MPTYDYVCQDCGRPFAIRVSIATYSEGVTPSCSNCGSDDAVRSFALVNVLTGSRVSGRALGAGGTACDPSGFT
ncbi:MAG: zinc ribbon domain-containing protein [Gemmatimonadetes bacterium]|nr:zinc ribbon domain-containing protein [Gemmatimonadota bacterium]